MIPKQVAAPEQLATTTPRSPNPAPRAEKPIRFVLAQRGIVCDKRHALVELLACKKFLTECPARLARRGSDPILGAAFKTALHLAAKTGSSQVSAFLPGTSDVALSIAVEHGMRITFPMVLLSTHDFGNWAQYLPGNPGFM